LTILSIVSALLINLLFFFISIFYLKKIIKKPWRKFLKVLYTMIMLRFGLVLILFFIFIKLMNFDKQAFSLTFILSYFVILFFEIIYINKRFSNEILMKRKI
jgi:hypothetical protein